MRDYSLLALQVNLLSSLLSKSDADIFGLNKTTVISFLLEAEKYIEFHRNFIFKK